MRDCVDCGTCVVGDTGLVENYIVHDEPWAEAGMGYDDGFLCVNCLEGRLGRALTGADLRTDMPLNWPGCQRDTPRLHQLKSDAGYPPVESLTSQQRTALLVAKVRASYRDRALGKGVDA
jgi:hypothetical protein